MHPFAGVPLVESSLKGDKVLWRYMDFPSFVGLLSGRSLYLRRGDCFSDRHEGAFTSSIKDRIEKNIKDNQLATTYAEFKEKLRQRVFVSCWHESIDDSMAMWALYGKGNLSVAVTTTVDALQNSLLDGRCPHPIYIKKVKYVKHWRNPQISINPYSNVFKYKTKAYSFEKEVRIIVDRMEEDWNGVVTDEVINIDVDINKLIRSVVISPDSPEWFRPVVYAVFEKFGLDPTLLRRSKLSFDPI